MGIKPIGLSNETTVRRQYRASSVDELFATPRAGRGTILDKFTEYLYQRVGSTTRP
ncbi:hypothetical protein E143388_08261 [Rhodococcus opacus]|nr:hypothetical protein E143388_08261 [Rhodococcus opacus]